MSRRPDRQTKSLSQTREPSYAKEEITTPFKDIQEQKWLRDDEVIMYYFNKMRSVETRQLLLKLLDQYYFECQPKLDPRILRLLIFGSSSESTPHKPKLSRLDNISGGGLLQYESR